MDDSNDDDFVAPDDEELLDDDNEFLDAETELLIEPDDSDTKGIGPDADAIAPAPVTIRPMVLADTESLDKLQIQYDAGEALNLMISRVTKIYLDQFDPRSDNPLPAPSPQQIEADLLHLVNTGIDIHNVVNKSAKGSAFERMKRLSNGQIADIITTLYNVKRIAPSGESSDESLDLLAIYQPTGRYEGIYLADDDQIRSLARQYNYDLKPKVDLPTILDAVYDLSPRVLRSDNPDLIAVNNGIFNYRTKQIMPFDPGYIFLVKCPYDYVPNAQSPTIINPDDQTSWEVEDWMRTLSDDPEVIELLWQIIGACIRPNVPWNKTAWFYSERGNNGKGTLCALMRNLVGPRNVASIALSEFSKDFQLEQLTRASAVIVDENDVGTFIDKAAKFKAIVTGDVITIDRKFKRPIAYQFRGFMVQCLNEYPKIKDKSESLLRRQLFVPFDKCFTGRERKYIKNDYLNRKDVLEYVLWRVLNMADYYSLSEPEATHEVLEEFRLANDPVQAFYEEFKDEFVWDALPAPFLYDLYKAWFAETSPSGTILGRNKFLDQFAQAAESDGVWVRHSSLIWIGDKMDEPEPLIGTYGLTKWMNPTITSKTNMRRYVPVMGTNMRGFFRNQSGPIGVVDTAATDDGNTVIASDNL